MTKNSNPLRTKNKTSKQRLSILTAHIAKLVLASVNLNNMQALINNAEQTELRTHINALTNSVRNNSRRK